MSGGKGTRIASVASDIPKPMIPICGKPVLEHQIDCLKKYGLTDITIITGHLGHIIKDYFKNGSRFNCHITYYEEKEPLGSAGALFKIDPLLTDDFILLNGDIIFDINFSYLIKFHKDHNAAATLTSHPNSHPYDSSLLIVENDNKVIKYLSREEPRQYYKNLVNAGIHILTKSFLHSVKADKEKVDLDRDLIRPMVPAGNIFAYKTPEYIKDMGTPDRYKQVSRDMNSGIVSKKNLSNPQKAVFLDRDGTINKLNGFVTKLDDFELIEGAADAIKLFNSAGFLTIVITNQPVIARGEITLAELDLIHSKMETELGKSGAYLDDIFFCPHHPDKGFSGERIEYKIECKCRKPKPGMLFAAAKKYNIDLKSSYMIGDDPRDVNAGISAGCIPIFLSNSPYGSDIKTFSDLAGFSAGYFNDHCY
jgi:D,D-heptose 1,7-bisphosphate phosphatase